MHFDEFIEENSFIRENLIEQSIYRFLVWMPREYYKFVDFVQGTKWRGRAKEFNEYSTYDGVNFKQEKGHMIYSANFFKADEIVHHSFKA